MISCARYIRCPSKNKKQEYETIEQGEGEKVAGCLFGRFLIWFVYFVVNQINPTKEITPVRSMCIHTYLHDQDYSRVQHITGKEQDPISTGTKFIQKVLCM